MSSEEDTPIPELVGQMQNFGLGDADENVGSAVRGRGRGRGRGSGPNGGGFPSPGRSLLENSHVLNIPNTQTLSDIGGLNEQLRYFKRAVIYPMAHKDIVSQWGVSVPKGILFYGAPGTGKTLMAKAVVNELKEAMGSNITFIHRKGADCLGKYFGESEENLRKIFREAEEHKPCVLFFDEIDGLCPNRDNASQSCEVYSGVVTTFLGLVDSIKNGEILIIGATNRLDAVDPAVRRPGRFDKELIFHPPDEAGRKQILQIHTKKWSSDSQLSEELLNEIASQTHGLSGAHLENLCKEALNVAVERQRVASGDSFAGVKVLLQDWNAAMNGICSLVIHNNRIVQPLLSALLPLLTERIIDKFSLKMDEEKKTVSVSNEFMLKSFLIWDSVSNSNQDIENHLIPSLLSQTLFQKIPVFEVSQENANKSCITIGATIQQAFTSTKPCILYIPRINDLWDFCQENQGYGLAWIINKLNLTRGNPILLLASASIPVYNLPGPLKELFGDRHTFKMRKPNSAERAAFFEPLFGKSPDWIDVKTECVKNTDGKDIDSLVTIHGHIAGSYASANSEKAKLATAKECVRMISCGEL